MNIAFQKRVSIVLSLILAAGLMAFAPVNVSAEATEADPEMAEIRKEYDRLMEIEAADAVDALLAGLTEAQRSALLGEEVLTEPESQITEEPENQPEVSGAASGTCGEGLTWQLDDRGTLKITGSGPMKDYSAEEPAPWASRKSGIQSVTVENGVTAVGSWAFSGCEKLASVSLAGSVESIGMLAFENCTSLRGILLPAGLNNLEQMAFRGCTALTSLTVPANVKVIAGGTFQDCTHLTSISLPVALQEIRQCAFSGCTALKHITLPHRLEVLQKQAFENCVLLENIILPDSVTTLSEGTFRGCTGMTSVTLPNTLTAVEPEAFRDCASLRGVRIPASVTKIGDSAFENCTELRSLTLREGLEEVGSRAFFGCTALKTVTVPATVEQIGVAAFRDSGLEEIGFSGDVPSIRPNAFAGTALAAWYGENETADEQAEETPETEELPAAEEITEEVTEGTAEEAAEEAAEPAAEEKATPAEPEKEEIPEDMPRIRLESIAGSVGNTVTVTVTMENNPGVASVSLWVSYDENALELTGVEDMGLLPGGDHSTASPCRLSWVNDTIQKDIDEDGALAKLTFRLSKEASAGNYPVFLFWDPERCDIMNCDLEPVAFAFEQGNVQITERIIGDVNCDGAVNNRDRMDLADYLTGAGEWDGASMDWSAADVNEDGLINAMDRAILSRHLAGWEGYETLPHRN